MPKLTSAQPKLRRHSNGKDAIVQIDGTVHYLGPFGSQESRQAYDRKIGEWLANNRLLPKVREVLSVNELVLAYLKWADGYYRKDGRQTGEIKTIKAAMKVWLPLYGDTPAEAFGPLALKAVREKMIAMGWSRRYINKQIGRIARCFKWGVENELVLETVYRALRAVDGLKQGRCEAIDHPPVQPVPESTVEATLPHLSPIVADMVRFELLTGCRPQEVCALRQSEIDTSGKTWFFRPSSHKTMHHGRERIISIGPQAQEVIRPYLLKTHNEFAFNPQDAVALMREKRRSNRRTPLSCGNRAGTNRVRRPKKSPGNKYTTESYGRAVTRGCDLAFPPPEKLTKDEMKAWRKANHWRGNRLRHSAGTRIRREFGLEATQVVLGHSSADVTQIYAERDTKLGADVMQKIG